MTLTAAWSVSGTAKVWSTDKEQNPHVDLEYSVLEPGDSNNATPSTTHGTSHSTHGTTPSTTPTETKIPSIDIKLSDESGTVQETLISPSVTMSQSGKNNVQQAASQPNSKKITFQDIAGGIANIVKFFAK